MARALALGVATFSALGRAQPEAAQTNAPNALDAFLAQTREACGASPAADRFTTALQVELSSASFAGFEPASRRLIRCDVSAGTVTLVASDRELILDVSDVPSAARSRTLAVAVAETLRLPNVATPASHSPTPPSNPHSLHRDSPVQVVGGDVPRATHEPFETPSPGAAWWTPVTLRALVLGPRQTLALGASLGVSHLVAQQLRVGAHLGYLTASSTSVLGNARFHAGNVETTLDVMLLRPSASTTLDVGAGLGLYRVHVGVDSVWGVYEANVDAWLGLWNIHAELSTAASCDLRLLTHLRAVKDLLGLRLNAGGREAMSLHGFGVELQLGVAYAW